MSAPTDTPTTKPRGKWIPCPFQNSDGLEVGHYEGSEIFSFRAREPYSGQNGKSWVLSLLQDTVMSGGGLLNSTNPLAGPNGQK